ncbi:MAG: type IV pilus modification protein PilV [Rudaea sp.]|uniref:type IV pilus modification protein PilV n=1 Tax=Rudaea sp. TaxID=2136325 RepID=UPI0039E39401
MKSPPKIQRQCGATLVEVLVSVVVTSVGLLGLAGLMATTVKVNQGAYQRAQVGLAVQALVESMHVNPTAVAQGRYDGARANAGAASADCRKQACGAAARADDDLARFDRALANALPGAQASLKCDAAAGAVAADAYDGVCRIEIGWSERALAKGGEASPQSLVWVFQP